MNTLAATVCILGSSGSSSAPFRNMCMVADNVLCDCPLQVDAHLSYDSKATYDKVGSWFLLSCSTLPYVD